MKKTTVDILILISLYLVPKLAIISPLFNLYDEVVFMYMLSLTMYRSFFNKKDLLFPLVLTLYILYSFVLIFYNAIPLSHIAQIFISTKFLIIFLYFYTYPNAHKVLFFKKLVTFITYIFILSLLLSLLQFGLPNYFCGYSPDGRGLWGITAGGLFCSRILYASFLVLFIIMIMSIRTKFNSISKVLYQYRYSFLVLSLGLLFFSFARKELLIGVLLLIYLFNDRLKHESKIIFYFLLFFSFVGFIFIFMTIFSKVNNDTFTENQIRYHMLLYALDIFKFYFPFGSGPGTYGSIMSLDYPKVYELFDVPRYIYLGYGDAVRGPIFDLYLVGIMAEYGLGIFFFIWFLKKMAFSHSPHQIDVWVNSRKMKIALVFHLFIVALFVPIFLNWIGFLVFTLLGTLSTKRNTKINKRNLHQWDMLKARAIKMRIAGSSYSDIEKLLLIPSVLVAKAYTVYRKENAIDKKRWKNKTLESYAIVMRSEGKSYQEIENTLGVNIIVVARGYGIDRKKKKRWHNETIKNCAISMRKEGMAYQEIAKYLHLDAVVIARWYASHHKKSKFIRK